MVKYRVGASLFLGKFERIYHQYDGGWKRKYKYLRGRELLKPMITQSPFGTNMCLMAPSGKYTSFLAECIKRLRNYAENTADMEQSQNYMSRSRI